MAKTTKLDVAYKYVAIGVGLLGVLLAALSLGFHVYQQTTNTDNQRQLDDKQQINRLQTEFQATQIERQTAETQQHAAEQREREQKEYAHRARVEMCRAGLCNALKVHVTSGEDVLLTRLEGFEAFRRLYNSDVSQFGQDKAVLLWEPAWEQAKKEAFAPAK